MVQADFGQGSGSCGLAELVADGLGMDRRAVGLADDEVLILVVGAQGEPLLPLSLPMGFEGRHGGLVEGDRASALHGLRGSPDEPGRVLALDVGGDQGSTDTYELTFDVDVGPSQSERHTSAHACGGEQPPAASEAVASRGVEEGARLRGGPGSHLSLGPGAGRVGGVRGVARDGLPANGVAERPVQDRGDVGDRPWAELAVLIVACQEVAVPSVEVRGADVLQQPPSQRPPAMCSRTLRR